MADWLLAVSCCVENAVVSVLEPGATKPIPCRDFAPRKFALFSSPVEAESAAHNDRAFGANVIRIRTSLLAAIMCLVPFYLSFFLPFFFFLLFFGGVFCSPQQPAHLAG